MWKIIKATFAMVDWKDVWIRALKTSWQAALGAFASTFPTLLALSGDALRSALLSLLSSVISAAASAAWNGVLKPALEAWKLSL